MNEGHPLVPTDKFDLERSASLARLLVERPRRSLREAAALRSVPGRVRRSRVSRLSGGGWEWCHAHFFLNPTGDHASEMPAEVDVRL